MPLVLDGTNGVSGVDGTASNPSYEGTDSNTGIFFPAADTVAIGTGGTEALRVNSSQNVGIGTQSPTTILNIEKSAPSASVDILVRNTGTDGTSNARIMSFVSSASGGDPKIGVGITGVQDYFWYIDNSDSDKLKLDSNGSDLITVTSGGNVGIGTASPVSRLTVNTLNTAFSPSQTSAIGGANNTRVQFTAAEPGVMISTDINGSGTQTGSPTVSMGMQIGLYNTNDIRNQIWWSGGYPLTFTYSGTPGASPTERARITSDGDFLIGTTTGGSKLAVSDSNNRTEATAQFRIGGSGYSIYQWLDGTAAYIGQDSGSRSFRIYSSAETAGVNLAAGGTSWGTFSDERLKYDIEPIVDGLTKLANMRCVSYRLKDVDAEDSQKKLGVIAQDLVGVVDEVIDITKRSGDDTEYMSVRYTELTPVLIKAIQEQQAMIDEMKAELAALKGNA